MNNRFNAVSLGWTLSPVLLALMLCGCQPALRDASRPQASSATDVGEGLDGGEADAGEADAGVSDGGEADGGENEQESDPYVGPFSVRNEAFRVWNGERYRPFFVRSVNVGGSRPGAGPRDLDVPPETWARWFGWMTQIGFNSVRLYSLQDPVFYRALRDYNVANPTTPIYLIQGTYLVEPAAGVSLDLHGLTDGFELIVEETVDVIHGNRDIPERRGAAWGNYDVDVSEWTLAWLPGREVLAEEVVETDAVNPEKVAFNGVRLKIENATATEVWMAERLDHHVDYEVRTYGKSRPIAWSGWLETDPLIHPTEGTRSGKDVAQVDLGRIDPFGLETGYFVSYHVYPYYPDFVSEDPGYRTFSDELGPNSYLGILEDLRKHHRGTALFVAEFGVPSSWARAHTSFSGMHHGGLDEEAQGRFGARMFQNIYDAGAAGAAYFQWTDGWWKRIWITNPLTFPADRLPIWHDMLNPQQHYGVVAFELESPDFDAAASTTGTGRVRDVRATFNAEFVHLRVTLDAPLLDGERLTVGVDTYADDRGETLLPDGTTTTRRNEFALSVMAPDVAKVQVMRSYDLYAIGRKTPASGVLYRSTVSDAGDWVDMNWFIAAAHGSDDGVWVFPDEDHPIGVLRARRLTDPASSHDAVVIDGAVVDIRLPWTLLNFTDPSQRRVMDDDLSTPERETSETPGIAFSVAIDGDLVETDRRSWEMWNRAPATTDRLKAGTSFLSEMLAKLPTWLE